MSLAEILHIGQVKLSSRIVLCIPIIILVAGLIWWSSISAKTFNQLWNYFAWGNQVLGACTLTAATEWLISRKRNAIVTFVPGIFMTFIVFCYILWISPAHGGPVGFGLELRTAQIVAAVLAAVSMAFAIWHGLQMRRSAEK